MVEAGTTKSLDGVCHSKKRSGSGLPEAGGATCSFMAIGIV